MWDRTAAQKVRRRYGKNGVARLSEGRGGCYRIGFWRVGVFTYFEERGRGRTWEEAFQDANRREAGGVL